MTSTPLTAHDLADLLTAAIEEATDASPDDLSGSLAELAEALDGASMTSYADGGYLTRDAGFVIRSAGGTFQITIRETR